MLDRSRRRRVMVVDLYPIVRSGIARLFEREPDIQVDGEFDHTDHAIKAFRSSRPDAVICGLTLASGSGLNLIKALAGEDHFAPVLATSVHDETLVAERVLRAGAKGYISKKEPLDRLLNAIRHVLDGNIYLSPQMTERMLVRNSGRGQNIERSPIESLSDRELEVFEQIGRGVTTREIAEKLKLSPKTVETYRENIKSKLHLANATELTQYAVQWVFEG